MARNKNQHNNIMPYRSGLSDNLESFSFIIRGCTMHQREYIWSSYRGSINSDYDRENDNSYIIFEEEPDNDYDPNAIKIVIKGEHFGTAGYVGKEYTKQIKEILNKCDKYRVDLKSLDDIGQREMTAIMKWY